MEQFDICNQLVKLRDSLQTKESLKKSLNELTNSLQEAKSFEGEKLKEFDSTYKDSYVIGAIGNPPKKPSKLLAVAYPMYSAKKKEYNAELGKYHIAQEAAIAKYEQENKEKREELIKADETEKKNKIEGITHTINSQQKQLESVTDFLEKQQIINKDFLEVDVLNSFIQYFQHQRADSIKEAINLWYEEKYRKEIKNWMEEQSALLKAVSDKVDETLEISNRALDDSSEAIDRIQDIYYMVDEIENHM